MANNMEYGRFAALYDALMRGVDYEGWADYLSDLLLECGVTAGGSVVDCACGTGEITLRLQKRGFCTTGADRSPEMLEIAQQKARKAGIKIPFIAQDMRALCVHKPVDAVVCACDGVNYLLTGGDMHAFFTAAYAALKPGGALLFDISSAYKLETVLGMNTFGEDAEECVYLWRNVFDEKSRLLEMNLTFFVPNGAGTYERFDETHMQRAHAAEGLCETLEACGFTVLGVYDAFTKNAPSAASERIQFAARRNG